MDRSGRATTIVVIPAYNEESALPAVLRELRTVVPELDVVVVDDGSADATADAARAGGVTCVRLPFNLGIGGALRAGYRYAVEHDYQRAVQFDADGQHRADQICLLLEGLDGGADMVIGNRFGADGDYKVGWSRRAAMSILRVGVGALCRHRYIDTSSGFRAMARPLLDVFAHDYPVEYMDSVETLVASSRAGYDVREVSVVMQERAGGVASTRNLRLAYHYARLLVVLIGSPRRAMTPQA